MRKKTTSYQKSAKRGLLLVSTLVSVVMYAQTDKEIKELRAQNDVKSALQFKKIQEKKTLTVAELKAKAKKLNLQYRTEFDGKVFQLVGFDKENNPLYYKTYNAGAAEGTGATILNDETGIYSLDGAGINIYEWDGGAVRVAHQEFGGRAEQVDKATSLSDHATHVGGTMVAAGIDGRAKGMAYRANLKAHDWTSDINEMLTAIDNSVLLSNHSYGFMGGFEWTNQSGTAGWHWFGLDEDTIFRGYGKYGSTDQVWDYLVNLAPTYLPVKAAGNPRGDGPAPGGKHFVRIGGVWTESTKRRERNGGDHGFDCVNTGSIGKNILIVGAVEKLQNGYTGPQDVRPASFSAFGPTDDGRIKPDIVGIGVDILSTNSTGNTDYTTMSGTSMATPNVTGNLALLQQLYNRQNNVFMKSATLRALAIHTAKEAGGAPGPDYSFGWGLLDAKKAADVILTHNGYSQIKEGSEEKLTTTNSTKEYDLVASGTEPLKVTIAWVDPSPKQLPGTALNDETTTLVNDLDIKILDVNNNEYLPWVLNPQQPAAAATKGDNTRDNVEQIVINAPTAGGNYKLIVSHKGTGFKKNKLVSGVVDIEDTDEQAFSLIITGLKADLAKDIEITEVKVNALPNDFSANTPVSVSFRNLGTEEIQNATINVVVKNKDTGAELATQTINVANVPSGESRTETLTFDLSVPFISYEIQAKAVLAGDAVEMNNLANTFASTTLVDLTPAQSIHRFGFEGDFLKNGWVSEDKDNDGRTWRQYVNAGFAKEGNNFAINFPNLKKGTDDWLFSNPLKMSANTKYIVSFHTRKLRAHDEPLQVFFGKDANSQSMTTQISPVISANTEYVHYIYEIEPKEDGIFHFGFNNKVGSNDVSYAVFLDDVIIKRAESKPDAGFSANLLKPTTYDNVKLNNETIDAPSTQKTYEWTISPNTVQYVSGNANSASPVVKFNEEGTYTISLKVTNSFGSDEETKTSYITVKNEATKAAFSANKTAIFEGEEITFSNASTGKPAPKSYKWEITPSEGVVFVNGNTALNPKVKFDKKGTYKVSLTAISDMNEATEVKDNYITVKTFYEPVRNLTADLDKNTKDVELKWVRPVLLDNYTEGFENGGTLPSTYTFIDGNNDGRGWGIRKDIDLGSFILKFANSGTYGAVSLSATDKEDIDADNWMITDKQKAGGEVLKFYAYAPDPYVESLEVYAVPAPASGQAPKLGDIKPEHKVFDKSFKNKDFELFSVDLKGKTDEDYFLAFYHKTKKEAGAFYLAIDDISIGYDNELPKGANYKKPVNEEAKTATREDIEQIKKGNVLYEEIATQSANNEEIVAYAATNYPALVGYKVMKNNAELKTINDAKTLTTTDNVANDTGIVKYDVIALYSGGKESTEETVNVDLTTLATVEANPSTDTTQVYPNPSTGLFTIDAGKGVSSFNAKVYDMSGKLVLEKVSKEQKTNIDLTAYGTGVYILNVVMENGKQVSIKLMVK